MSNSRAHYVPVLVTTQLLKPLGNPPQNGTKFFATKEVLELARDEKWLNRVTLATYQHWHKRNAKRATRDLDGLASSDSN